MSINDIKLSVFEDEIIGKLDGDNLIKPISLDDDESFGIVSDTLWSDVGDIDPGIRVFESDLLIPREDLAVPEL